MIKVIQIQQLNVIIIFPKLAEDYMLSIFWHFYVSDKFCVFNQKSYTIYLRIMIYSSSTFHIKINEEN